MLLVRRILMSFNDAALHEHFQVQVVETQRGLVGACIFRCFRNISKACNITFQKRSLESLK